jgi:hypothetical protein
VLQIKQAAGRIAGGLSGSGKDEGSYAEGVPREAQAGKGGWGLVG